MAQSCCDLNSMSVDAFDVLEPIGQGTCKLFIETQH